MTISTSLALLDECTQKQCVLQIFRVSRAIMVRVVKNGSPIAFGSGINLCVALQRASAEYLKIFDKFDAQMARYNISSNTSYEDKLTNFILNGGRLYIERKYSFSPIVATASNWYGNIVCERRAHNLSELLNNLLYSPLPLS